MGLPTYPQISNYSEVPSYMQKNKYIRHGYRVHFSPMDCIKSIMMLSNETLNIWSRLLGAMWFIYKIIIVNKEVLPGHKHSSNIDYIIMTLHCLCFTIACLLSATFHIFCCHSKIYHEAFFNFNLFGSTVALWGCCTTSLYYAFHCFKLWKMFYIVFFSTLLLGNHILQLFNHEKKAPDFNVMLVSLLPVLLGIIPAAHWSYISGGFKYQAVYIFAPCIVYEYVIGGIAVFIYLTKIPERFLPGRLDYLGTSHQLWHVLVLLLMVWWYNACLHLVDFSLSGTLTCPNSYD